MVARVLTESQEDYLEAILVLEKKNRVARVSEIATALHVRKSSVTAALKSLSAHGLAVYTPYAHVVLTGKGARVARALARNHARLKRFFMERLGIPAKAADRNACRMEHALDPEVMEKLMAAVEQPH
ncbi:MAG: metal-dependent transcriptional regulator [Fibrobacterota bacterium]